MKSRPVVLLGLVVAVLILAGAITGTSWAQTGAAPAAPDTVSNATPPASAPATTPPESAPAATPPAGSSTPTSTPTSIEPTTPPPPPAQQQAKASSSSSGGGGPFSRGTMTGSFTAGWGRSFGQDY